MINACKRRKRISFARCVRLTLDERGEKLRRVGNERRRVAEDGCNSEDGILTNICMTMFKAGSCRRQKRLDELWFSQLAEES